MTLYELSMEYQAQADTLHTRILQLRQWEAGAGDEAARLALHDRLRVLTSMWRDTREVAAHTRHYYERSRCRNASFIL